MQHPTYVVVKDETTWHASIPEYKGCFSEGDSPEEAFANLLEARDIWLEAYHSSVSTSSERR